MLEQPEVAVTSKSPSTIMASLSLYLIILAFFIMMNSISQREGSRTEGVLESISNSFKELTQTTMVTLDIADQGVGLKSAAGFENSIKELFESAFPLAHVEVTQASDQIEVTLPLHSMFAPGSTTIQGKNEVVLDRLANMLAFDAPGKVHEIEALLSWAPPADSAGGEAAVATSGGIDQPDAKLAINRAGALARELTARGVAAASVAIGIERRLSDTLRLTFTTRPTEPAAAQTGDKP